MASITKDQVIDFIANMSVLEMSELVKEMEEKFSHQSKCNEEELHSLRQHKRQSTDDMHDLKCKIEDVMKELEDSQMSSKE